MGSSVKAILRVRQITARREIAKAFAIRMRVFVKEQGVPAEIELDSDDERATHFLAYVGTSAVGTARIVARHGTAKIGRMAVSKNYRGRGIGKELLQRATETAKKRGAKTIYLHAQVPVIGFYQSMGFRSVGPIFDEAGIPHRKMILKPRKKARRAIRRQSAVE